jgi:hypothetical protein
MVNPMTAPINVASSGKPGIPEKHVAKVLRLVVVEVGRHDCV